MSVAHKMFKESVTSFIMFSITRMILHILFNEEFEQRFNAVGDIMPLAGSTCSL